MSRYVGNAWEPDTDIEKKFSGLYYLSCKGLSAKGKIKNIYTETYAETDELRVFLPEHVSRDNVDIEFTFGFSGKNRRNTYDDFIDWISGYKIKYWDTCRNREVQMILIENIEPSDDELIGSEPFMKATFKFKNLNGQTVKHT